MSQENTTYDVVVVGAGPAGIAAGARAAEAGALTLVVDEGLGPGGQIWRPGIASAPGGLANRWLDRLNKSAAAVLRSTSVVDIRAHGQGFLLTGQTHTSPLALVSRTVVLATGARELFLPFEGWTLPNVFGIGGAQALLKAGTEFHGKRVVMSGSGPLMLPVAASLAKAGAALLLVAEQAPRGRVIRYASRMWRKPSMLAQAAALRWAFRSAPYETDTWIASARGDGVVREVSVRNGRDRTTRTIACDAVCTGFGLVPNTELARLAGCAIERGAIAVDQWQATTIPGVYAAGEPTGIGGVHLSLVEGEIAGFAAAGHTPPARLSRARRGLLAEVSILAKTFAVRREVTSLATAETIVCRCEDVRVAELDPRWSARQAKLYTRAGMGPCQGRVCGAALECVMGWPADTVRPPSQPARVGTLLAQEPVAPL